MPKKSGTFLRIFELREGMRRGIPAGHYRRGERDERVGDYGNYLWLDGEHREQEKWSTSAELGRGSVVKVGPIARWERLYHVRVARHFDGSLYWRRFV